VNLAYGARRERKGENGWRSHLIGEENGLLATCFKGSGVHHALDETVVCNSKELCFTHEASLK
jgi:hypothetical protein